jgi:branched-chain amino acid transport system permease protein
VAVQRILFDEGVFGWLIPERVERPSLFFVSFASERNYYYLVVAFTVLAAILVKRLRRSRPGRVLIAQREDETGVQTFGINLARARLAAFALSGSLCGLAGVLFVHHQRAVDAGQYGSAESVAIFVMAMIGGVTSVTGALLGATYLGLLDFIVTEPLLQSLSREYMLLILLIFAPGGLAGIAYSIRDSWLRIVATRERIPVPSLFADQDPEALRAEKQPFGEPIPGRGLEKVSTRYRIKSELYPAGGTP